MWITNPHQLLSKKTFPVVEPVETKVDNQVFVTSTSSVTVLFRHTPLFDPDHSDADHH